ncbi:hypothetical protein [Phyllobacterium endophyticum]|uniref:hypothetical protein n=1 Tax=Phyllobacterium endophyticum TaxID=1149773 RepID=UPI0011C8E4A1|nr:hypothetical protein [Phyllobacterium endophyticum]TXR49893.1 hypothetical protein FVA77_07725 [Phyllobacterium endophyticum]
MADILNDTPFVYPNGSFYQSLDKRIKSLEAMVEGGAGAIPDGAINTFKIADGAVSSRALQNGTIVSDDIADASIGNVKIAPKTIAWDRFDPESRAKYAAATIASLTVPTGTATGITLSASVDNMAIHSSSPSGFRVKRTGLYAINSFLAYSAGLVAGNSLNVIVLRNGAAMVTYSDIAETTSGIIDITRAYYLTANDLIQFQTTKGGTGSGTCTFSTTCYEI